MSHIAYPGSINIITYSLAKQYDSEALRETTILKHITILN